MKIKFYLILSLFSFCLSSCTHMFLYPSKKFYYDPQKFGYKAEELSFKSEDGTKLVAWYFPNRLKKTSKIVVINFHGNAENISSHFIGSAWLSKLGYDVFIFDYRGFGKSQGSKSVGGSCEDAKAAIDFVASWDKTKDKDIVIWGQSLGGALALYAAAKSEHLNKIKKFVIESSFLSYQKVAREKMNGVWFMWPFQHLAYVLVTDKYSPKPKLNKFGRFPLFVIHARNDNVVPFHHGEELFKLWEGPKVKLFLDKGAHGSNMFVENGKYRPVLLKFLK